MSFKALYFIGQSPRHALSTCTRASSVLLFLFYTPNNVEPVSIPLPLYDDSRNASQRRNHLWEAVGLKVVYVGVGLEYFEYHTSRHLVVSSSTIHDAGNLHQNRGSRTVGKQGCLKQGTPRRGRGLSLVLLPVRVDGKLRRTSSQMSFERSSQKTVTHP